MTDLHTPSTGPTPHPGISTGRAGGVPEGAPPRALGDFPDLREPPRPVTLVYAPGECRVLRNHLLDPTLRQVLQAVCRDLGLDPAELAFGKRDSRSAWILADRIGDGIGDDGTMALRRVGQVQGLSHHWLRMGANDLVRSRWLPLRSHAEPPAPSPPPATPPD